MLKRKTHRKTHRKRKTHKKMQGSGILTTTTRTPYIEVFQRIRAEEANIREIREAIHEEAARRLAIEAEFAESQAVLDARLQSLHEAEAAEEQALQEAEAQAEREQTARRIKYETRAKTQATRKRTKSNFTRRLFNPIKIGKQFQYIEGPDEKGNPVYYTIKIINNYSIGKRITLVEALMTKDELGGVIDDDINRKEIKTKDFKEYINNSYKGKYPQLVELN